MNNLPEGYKQTEVGVIPEDWDVKKLGEIADITKLAGFEYTKYFNNYKDGGEVIVIRGTNITNNKLDLSDIKTIPRSTSNNLQRSKLQKNDLVFAYVGTIGPVYLIEENDTYHLGPNTARITVNKDISSRFAFCYFNSSFIKNEIINHTSIGAQPSLSMTKIRKFQIILPLLPEQKAIAFALSDTDALITVLEQLITKKCNIKQGAMQQLLTGEKRLPGFSGEWDVKKLGEIADIDSDNLSNSADPEYSFHYISLEDVDYGTLRNTTELLFKNAPSRARRKIRNDDILLSTVRPNLKSHLLLKKEISNWICSTGFSVVRCRNNMAHSGFVFNHLFSSVIDRQIETLIIGSNYPAINSKDVKSLLIPIPPTIDEQIAIAQILSDMDAEIEALEQKRAKYKAIKQGMMQELLTGKTRLV